MTHDVFIGPASAVRAVSEADELARSRRANKQCARSALLSLSEPLRKDHT